MASPEPQPISDTAQWRSWFEPYSFTILRDDVDAFIGVVLPRNSRTHEPKAASSFHLDTCLPSDVNDIA